MGLDLYDWQRHVGDVSLELVRRRRPGSRLRLAASTVGVVVGRASGKSTFAACRATLQCLLPELPEVAARVGLARVRPQRVAMTAQDRANALARWHEHVEILMGSELADHVERVVLQRGDEKVRFVNGSTYEVVTPSRNGPRGRHVDLVVIDEALAHEAWLLSVLRPMMAQRDSARGCIGAQLLLVSNAGDDRAELLNDARELGRRAVAERDTSRLWFEWSAPDGVDVYDENVWARTIPTLEVADGIGLEFLRVEAETMPLDDFKREYLCVHTSRPSDRVIDPVVWAGLPRDELNRESQIVLAVDATRDRTAAAVVAAGRLDEDDEHSVVAVEVLEQRPGAEWVAGYVARISADNNAPVVVDAHGPLSSIIPVLERSAAWVRPVRVGDVVDAAAMFCDLVATRRLAHQVDPRLADAVAGVGRRKVGDRWAFSRHGDTDISPLVAASLATWAVETEKFPMPMIHWPQVNPPPQ